MRYLEQISEGEEVVFEDVYHVTEEEIIEVGNRWDPQTFHTDPEAAKHSILAVWWLRRRIYLPYGCA